MAKKYEYKANDLFYDVESLANVFTVAWYYPAKNAIIISYLDDDRIIKSQDDLQQITNAIYKAHPRLANKQTHIYYEDIGQTGALMEYATKDKPFHPGMQTFAKRLGLANRKTYFNQPIDKRGAYEENRNEHYPKEYFPVKDTDPDYDAEQHGYLFSYNGTNYDTTMLADLCTRILDTNYHADHTHTVTEFMTNVPLRASDMRAFNDELFTDKWRGNMPKRLAKSYDNSQRPNFQHPAWVLRKAWLYTNRFIDVAVLNEKQQKVGLKRLLGVLGLQIAESDKLTHDNVIHSLDEMIDLIVYNISDVVNLQVLFETKHYQNAFRVRRQLLKNYPQCIYGPKKETPTDGRKYECDAGNYLNVRRDRLFADSTSAKFVEIVNAPYEALDDIPAVSFMFPHPDVAKKKGIEPRNILDETKKYFETHVTSNTEEPAHQAFMAIYNFYKQIEGRNFNRSHRYNKTYPEPPLFEHTFLRDNGEIERRFEKVETVDNEYVVKQLGQYNTNLFYYYVDDEGRVHETSCLANFSIGGIHGAEMHRDLYMYDQMQYQMEKTVLDYVKSQFETATDALNAGVTTIEIPEHLPVSKALFDKMDGRKIRIRQFMKSGSTKKQAEWKELKPIPLFKKNDRGVQTLNKRYNYVSVGKSNHEDFESYYPLMLILLRAFLNPDYHGFDEEGEPIDMYENMYKQRAVLKVKAKQKDIYTPEQCEEYDIEQESRKLMINAGSGVGDATFDNNMRVNNTIISMRIIGQLFAWRIGQAQTLAGARVPSTNTDGLYTMDIDQEKNDRILKETASDMYVKIEPEVLDRFVTKDSNNRLEYRNGRIVSAKGGTLTSHEGPSTTQSLDHPAILDYVLARLLANPAVENPANEPFNEPFARHVMQTFIQEHIDNGTPQEALRFFQWILASSLGKHRYYFAKHHRIVNGEIVEEIENLQHYNRIFLTKRTHPDVYTDMHLAVCSKLKPETYRKRKKDYQNGLIRHSEVLQHDKDAWHILKANGFDLDAEQDNPYSTYHTHEAKVNKLKNMPEQQAVAIYNWSILDLPHEKAVTMLQFLDIDAYLDMVEKSFRSWQNTPVPKD